MSHSRRWCEPANLEVRAASQTGFRIVDEILVRRGYSTPALVHEWLNPALADLTRDVVVPGLDDVVARIGSALSAGERILVFGDYDCDGVTSTAILVSALRSANPTPELVTWRLPGREDGYGLRESHIEAILAGGPGLLITVDCGSNDIEEIAAVRAGGMDVVVIDHHQISGELPTDVAVANPQRDPDRSTTQLTGAGLAWLVASALAREGYAIAPGISDEQELLDLAAIGTIGDVGLLTGINRAIVRDGTIQMRLSRRLGLTALTREAGVELKTITADNVSFKIAPRLNAPGRIDRPDSALELMLVSDWDRATELARQLLSFDVQRRTETERIMLDIEQSLGDDDLDPVLVVVGDQWRHGLLGPVASKLTERYGRPAIVLAGSGDNLTGSARSVSGWNIGAALNDLAHLLVKHGGHDQAAGMTVARSNLLAFREALNEHITRSGVTIPVVAAYEIDADIDDDDVVLGLGLTIERLAPFGQGNPRPILRWKDVEIRDWKAVGSDKSHAQLYLMRGRQRVRAIMFSGVDQISQIPPGERQDFLFRISVDLYRNQPSLSVQVVDLRPSEPAST